MASERTAGAEVHVSKERLRQRLRTSPSKPGIASATSVWGRLSDQALQFRPYCNKLRHYSQSDHTTASTVVPWRHASTGCQSSVFLVAVTCYPGFILRHRFLKPPARTQTPLAVRRIRWCTWQACTPLDIAVGSVLRLAECPSGRRRTTSAAASQKLSICCPAEQTMP